MKKSRILTWLLPAALVASISGIAPAQDQPGGGSLTSDVMGGAALIFRKPADPAVRVGGGTSRTGAGTTARTGAGSGSRTSETSGARGGGGRVSGRSAKQDRIIARANAARSAAKPRYSEAELEYKLAAKEDPTDARAHLGLGNVYLDQGRFPNAIDAYREAIKVKPD